MREDMTQPVREARQRVFGLSEVHARLPDATDVLGRLCLLGVPDGISTTQRDAGRLYEEIVHTYGMMMLARRMRSSSDMDLVAGHDSSDGTDPTYVEKFERAKGRWTRARQRILTCGDHRAQIVLDAVVLEDRPMHEHLGTLREVLNALAHEFRDELIRVA